MRWIESWRADPVARELADRHYNRQKIGSKQFVPPGRCIVLVTDDGKAFWISAYPIAKYVQHAWAGAWMCTAFRNEGAGLSSELITEAVAATRWLAERTPSWEGGAPPPLGFVSFVDPTKTKPKNDPGYCYLKAGWTRLERCTKKDNLVVYQLLPADMPPPAPPKRLRTRKKPMTTSNALAIPTEVQAELVTEADRTKQFMSLLQSFQIISHDTHVQAGALVQNVKAKWAELEVKRTSITQPINEALRAVNALFSPVQGPLKQAEVILKSKIAAYTLEQHQLQERAMQAAAAAIQAGQMAAATQHVATLAPAVPLQGISVKPKWAYEIIDADAVPRQFCSPDHAKIMAAIPKEVHPNLTPQIAGLRIFVEGAVRVGGRK